MGIDKTAFDTSIINNNLKQPLLIEVKEFRNCSQPFQRASEEDSTKKKNQTFLLKAHDGVRLLKIILLFEDQAQFVRSIYEVNKICLYDAYLSPIETTTFVVESQE